MGEIQFYGIRHHGPGSALRVKKALEDWKPDLILIELPADAQPLLDTFNPQKMQPPVSILIYDPGSFSKAAYFPMAQFSPEWHTLCYGFENLVPCKAIDLPMSLAFTHNNISENWIRNPFQLLAEHTEFNDVEQWWDHFLENNQSSQDLFMAVEHLMDALRNDLPDSEETIKREIFMKDQLRKHVRQKHQRIAVVCGAYHVPALRSFDKKYKSSSIKKKSIKTEAIWIPWSYERLTQKNAYGAGVHHPTWYEALFNFQAEAGHYWVAYAISVLRSKGKNVSSAHSVEILRLAETLRKLRTKNRIGIPELEESLRTIVFDGEKDWVNLYGQEIFIGSVKGKVKEDLYEIPLQKDFRKNIKKARLTKVLLKQTNIQKTLDLRKDIHRDYSRFFYQTNVLQIPLAQLQDSNLAALGTFKETWDIAWDPISEWTIVQAGTYGTTIASAAQNKLEKKIQQAEEIDALVDGLKESFFCGFEDLFDVIQKQMIRMYAVSNSIVSLLESLETLIYVDQYGHIRWQKTPNLGPLIERLASRIAQLLPSVVLQLSKEIDQILRRHLIQVLYALANPLYKPIRDMFSDTWIRILTQNNQTDYYHGLALKQAIDQDLIGSGFIDNQFTRHFSDPQPESILNWLEGLLSGQILWVIYDRAFLHRLNLWIGQMNKSSFNNNLPVLRQLFTQAGAAERQKLFQKIQNPDNNDQDQHEDLEGYPEEIQRYIKELTDQYFWHKNLTSS